MSHWLWGAITKEHLNVFTCRYIANRIACALRANPNAGAALQELLGGKYGEMSTLGNYMFQSFNFRSKSKLRPFYSLVAAITAEELGHVELVSNGVAMLNNGPDTDLDEEDGGDISGAPYEAMADIRLASAFFANGGGAVPVNSNGQSWNNDFVTTTGNVIFDLLHNFHLECGARLHELRSAPNAPAETTPPSYSRWVWAGFLFILLVLLIFVLSR